MKVTLTRYQVTEMMLCLKGTLEQGKNIPYKWKYALSKNIDRLEAEEKTIERALRPGPEFAAYNKERIKLAESLCDRDEKGQPIFFGDNITTPRQYKIVTNKEAFDKALEELEARDEYKECIAERNRMNTPEFREETQEYELHEIRVLKSEQDQLEKGEIVIPGASFRFTQKIMVDAPELSVV